MCANVGLGSSVIVISLTRALSSSENDKLTGEVTLLLALATI